MSLTFDERRFPLVEIRFEAPVTDADIDRFCVKMRELANGGRPYASVFDAAGVMSLPASQRQKMVAISKELEEQSRRVVVVACLAFDNALARGVVTAVNWFSPPPFEQRFFSNLDAARRFAISRLAERGLKVPE